MRRCAQILLLSGWILWAGGGVALTRSHSAEPDSGQALALLRIHFERSLIESSLTPLKKHLTELAVVERQRSDARDYLGAIEARDQRRKLEDELERLDKELLLLQTREQSLKASLLPDRIVLALDSAELMGGVRREGGALTNWSKPGTAARWKLPGLPLGGYEVILRYRCGAVEGGTVQVQENRFSLKGDIETTLKGPEEKNLGTLKITDGSGTLTILAAAVVKDNLMQLLAVELVPASR